MVKTKNAAYSAAYGAVTSTIGISRELLDESGRAEREKGAAYRYRDDAVAGGAYLGPGRTGGRTTLFDVGTRKLTVEGAGASGPLSDSENEEEELRERAEKEKEKGRARAHDEEQAAKPRFYRQPRPAVLTPRARVIISAEKSDLMLLRHLPYRPPHDPLPHFTVDTKPVETAAHPRLDEGTALRKKKRKVDDNSLLPLFGASEYCSSSSPASTISIRPPFSSSLPTQSSTSAKAAPVRHQLANPFARSAATTATTPTTAPAGRASVKTGGSLPRRAGLAAFQRR